MRIFLDANVNFSASNPASNVNRLIRHLIEIHRLISSDYAMQEAFRSIRAKRPEWEEGHRLLMINIEMVPSLDGPVSVDIADKDRPILATAIHQHCDVLLTGDKRDFGPFFDQEISGVRVLTPLMMAERLGETD